MYKKYKSKKGEKICNKTPDFQNINSVNMIKKVKADSNA